MSLAGKVLSGSDTEITIKGGGALHQMLLLAEKGSVEALDRAANLRIYVGPNPVSTIDKIIAGGLLLAGFNINETSGAALAILLGQALQIFLGQERIIVLGGTGLDGINDLAQHDDAKEEYFIDERDVRRFFLSHGISGDVLKWLVSKEIFRKENSRYYFNKVFFSGNIVNRIK